VHIRAIYTIFDQLFTELHRLFEAVFLLELLGFTQGGGYLGTAQTRTSALVIAADSTL
jgi:hypothetical protein